MPAKPNLLPQPCPICGKANGTVLIVRFSSEPDQYLIKIGHYNSEKYRIQQELVNALKKEVDGGRKKATKSRGRIWDTFRTRYDFSFDPFPKISYIEEFTNKNTDEVFKKEYFKDKPYQYKTLKDLHNVFNHIKQYGWGKI